jgi:uncharacterized protein YndB with AHSA1/START domain
MIIKLIKVVALLVVLVFAFVLIVGFASSPEFEDRHEVLVDAPPGKVWEIVSDPKRTPEWLPKEMTDGGIVEVRTTPAGEKLLKGAEQLLKTGSVDPKSLGRHTYVRADKKTMTLEVVAYERNKKYMERVVETDTGMDSFFPEMQWGFELAEAGEGKTRLTVIDGGRAARPHGTFMGKMMAWTGRKRDLFEKMARNIETLAKGDKPK